ncbi:MAG: hypothetical protein J5I98_18085 [Phaeodactylibacter sp.]|nr:hypothetical protein [Phaeodactylibacter sp.]
MTATCNLFILHCMLFLSRPLILIYDGANVHPGISPLNDGTPNDLGVYQIPLSSPCLVKKAGAYFSGGEGAAVEEQDWEKILPLSRSGDAVQLRDSLKALRFAVNWAGEAFLEYSGPQVANVEVQGENALNAIALVEKVCEEDGEAGYESDFLGSPGVENSMENGLYINRVSSGIEGSALSISCDEYTPASNTTYGVLKVLIQGGLPPYTVEWNGPNSSSGYESANTEGAFFIQNLSEGKYWVRVIDSRGCEKACSSFISQLTTIYICNGECLTIGEENPSGEYCYFWAPRLEPVSNTSPSQQVCPEEDITYTLTITDKLEGEIVEIQKIQIEVDNTIATTPSSPIICESGDIITLDAGEGYDSYSWNTGSVSQVIYVQTPGHYVVTVTKGTSTCTKEVEVYDSESQEDIRAYLESLGFTCMPVSIVNLPTTLNSVFGRGLLDNELEVEINGEIVQVNLALSEYINTFNSQGLASSAYLTYAEDLCNGYFEYVGQEYENNLSNFLNVWLFAWENPDEEGEDCLFFKQHFTLPENDVAFSGSPEFCDCTVEEKLTIEGDIARAINDIDEVISKLSTYDGSYPKEIKYALEKNFGGANSTIASGYLKYILRLMKYHIHFSNFRCEDNSLDSYCGLNADAYAYPFGGFLPGFLPSGKITICRPNYFNGPGFERSGTLIHEWMHFGFGRGDLGYDWQPEYYENSLFEQFFNADSFSEFVKDAAYPLEVTATASIYHRYSTLPPAFDLLNNVPVTNSQPDDLKFILSNEIPAQPFTGSWRSANGAVFLSPNPSSNIDFFKATYNDIYIDYDTYSTLTHVVDPMPGDIYICFLGEKGFLIKVDSIDPNDNTCQCSNPGKLTFTYRK